MKEPKILQLLPADHWSAVFEDNGKPIVDPLVCWALVKHYYGPDDEAERLVVGLISDGSAGIDQCTDVANFLGYLAPQEDVSLFNRLAEEAYTRREQKKRAS